MNRAAEIRSLIATHFNVPPEAVNDATKLSDLGADSLDPIEVVLCLEDQCHVIIHEDLAEDSTFAHIVAVVERAAPDRLPNPKRVGSNQD